VGVSEVRVTKLLRITLYVVGGILTLYSALMVYTIRTAGSDEGRVVATKQDLPAYVTGRWDWKSRSRPCTDSAHVITFGPGARTMEVRLEERTRAGRTDDLFVYDVLKITPTRIRGTIRGMNRVTDAGKPIVWDLVMFDANEYRWQRTDWAPWNYTGEVVRCSEKGIRGDVAERLPDGNPARR
jgi:hypothetical protein